ncbi:MAG: 16S rRNA (uracil(1498)-N(3))-methyltransferase [Paucibacter sp.]|nr:16S rRNA (uracil(1498)-N(3))-methyltransferase [Roseateles sp.]
MARLFVEEALAARGELSLPAGAARHVQVLRLQPGAVLTLFDGSGLEWPAAVLAMGRSEVRVGLGEPVEVDREMRHAVHLAVVMPANDRMDGIVEKATELGAASIQPLMSERSVLRLSGDRAEKKRAHWRGVAVAAAEQCGRARVTAIEPVQTLMQWLASLPVASQRRWLLSPTAAEPLARRVTEPGDATLVFSGPEGGLASAEEEAARARGFVALSLGPRVLRADTAPLAVLGALSLQSV